VLRRSRSDHAVPSSAAVRRTSSVANGGGTWRVIEALLISAAALDLTRCSLVLMTLRHLAPGIGLVAAGIGAAAISVTAARGCRAGHRWANLAALVIGVASAPLASASGFRAPFTIPDVATAILGIVLAVVVLATVGRGTPGPAAVRPCAKSPPGQLCGTGTDSEPSGRPGRGRVTGGTARYMPGPDGSATSSRGTGQLLAAARGSRWAAVASSRSVEMVRSCQAASDSARV
jgi:hypothetical protein